MARPLDTNRIIAEVLAGQHSDQLPDLFSAVLKAVSASEAGVRWAIDYEGLEVTEDSLTVGECVAIEEETGLTWARIQPSRSALMARAVLTAALMKRKGMGKDEARERVEAIPALQFLKMVREYVVPASPLDQQAVDPESEPNPFE